MPTYRSCPIGPFTVEEITTRITAAIVTLLVALTLWSGLFALAMFLLADFILRSSPCRSRSPVALLSRLLRKLFSAPAKQINAGPKLFAAKIGILFSLLLAIGTLLQQPLLLWLSGGLFATCALLEAAVGFCVACHLYPTVLKIQKKVQQRRTPHKTTEPAVVPQFKTVQTITPPANTPTQD